MSRGNGVPGCEIYSIWLAFQNQEAPFLEIHQHRTTRARPQVNDPGYAHLSFHVADFSKTLSDIIRSGGETLGEITNFGTQDAPLFIACTHDPEGNIIGP